MAKEYHLRRLLASIADDSDEEISLPHHSNTEGPKEKSLVSRLFAKPLVISLLFAVGCILSFWGGTCVRMRQSTVDGVCAQHTTQWSPVIKDVPIRYGYQEFNGSFMEEDIYRQIGSTEVDKAWEDLGTDYRAGVILYEDGLASGLTPSFVQRAAKYGGGFIVNVEGMHHLHCLNLVRKALYFNYDRYKELGEHAFANEEYILRRHISVLGQVWIDPEEPTAFPDFRTKHVCKNFDDIRKWAEKLQAPPPDQIPKDYLAPPRPGDVIGSTP